MNASSLSLARILAPVLLLTLSGALSGHARAQTDGTAPSGETAPASAPSDAATTEAQATEARATEAPRAASSTDEDARVATPARTTTSATTRTRTATEPGRVSTGGARVVEEEEEPEPEGDGRDVDFIWFELEGGVSSVDLIAFRDANFASIAAGEPAFDNLRGTGPMAGLGVGFRVYWLTVGARGTYANYQNFDIGTIGGDVALRLPIPVVEPYARVGFGYAWQGQANYRNPTMSATTVYGWSFDAALGIDIYLVKWFTIGAGAGLNLLNMSRQSDPTQPCMGVTDICPGNPGDAVGYQLRGFIQVGLRF